MSPKDILLHWVDAFNNEDAELISDSYDENAINHQVANEPVDGKKKLENHLNKNSCKRKWFVLLKIF